MAFGTLASDQLRCFQVSVLEYRTIWNGRFYHCLKSGSADKRGRTEQKVNVTYIGIAHIDKDDNIKIILICIFPELEI